MSWITKLVDAGATLAASTGAVGAAAKSLGAVLGGNPEEFKNIVNYLNQPSLCYVPIMATSLRMHRTVDIGTTMLITQTSQSKEYITDNAAPRPRVWSVKGFIESLAPLQEQGLVIKPSVQVQQSILDSAADSRQPVKFKTDTGEVVDVLIQNLEIGATEKGQNVRTVEFTVQEVKVLENNLISDSWISKFASTKFGQSGIGKATIAAAKSVPVRSVINLGKGSLIGTGTVLGGAALLNLI